jgi:hypothetical protein
MAVDVRIAFYFSLLAFTPQSVFPVAGQSGDAGSRTCAVCHADIYKRQQSSNHARSLRRPGEIEELTAGLPFQYKDRSSQALLTLRQYPKACFS